MPVAYSLNLRVFWSLALCLCAGALCLLHGLRRAAVEQDPAAAEGAVSSFPLLGVSTLLLLCYLLVRHCGAHTARPPLRPIPAPFVPVARRALLEAYYEQHLRLSPHLLGHSKAHVRLVVGALLRAGKARPQEPGLALRGDLVPVGSAYEQHKVCSPDGFDILVPLRLPPGLATELQWGPDGFGCRLSPVPRRAESAPAYRHFSVAFCLPPSGGPPLLCPALVLRWFQQRLQRCLALVRFQFQERCNIRLSAGPEQHRLTLHILPRSDYVCCHLSMAVRLIPALGLGDGLFLTAQPLHPQARWDLNLSRLEQKLLGWAREHAPADSCHLKCLQIMKGLRNLTCQSIEGALATQLAGALSSYILKTTLFYLLLRAPFPAWAESLLVERLEDFVLFLCQALQRRALLHFFMGNSDVPEALALPRSLKEAPPVNLLANFDASLLEMASLRLLDTWTRIPQVLETLTRQRYLAKSPARCHHTSSS
ncbi:inositol 1,4,5-trisphosphate receptor-interacting protein-like 2 [Ambystoma mexicanum]|uniref:inositol 1,4,5-trisphosphate receptor-interacting protein-like 2 n=1 Tax=Ambystoma mexicanum TaxID=8296 RepID=UPI0037E9A72F